MLLRLKLFAAIKQLVGADTLEVELAPGATVADLRAALAAQSPQLATYVPHLMFAVNAQYAADSTVIPAEAEVACIPPVSGG